MRCVSVQAIAPGGAGNSNWRKVCALEKDISAADLYAGCLTTHYASDGNWSARVSDYQRIGVKLDFLSVK